MPSLAVYAISVNFVRVAGRRWLVVLRWRAVQKPGHASYFMMSVLVRSELSGVDFL